MATTTRLITAEDLIRLPVDGFRYELVRGELRRMAPTGHEHGRVTARFSWRLAKHVETNGLGTVYAAETGFLLSSDPDTVRAPDVAFVSERRLEGVSLSEGYFPGAPDLAVEVVSPRDSHTAVEEKAIGWLESGALLVLTMDPQNRTVIVYRSKGDIALLTEDDVLELGDIVPDFALRVDELFG